MGWLWLRSVFEGRWWRGKSGRLEEFLDLLLLVAVGIEELPDGEGVRGGAYEAGTAMFGRIEDPFRVNLVLNLPLDVDLLIDGLLEREGRCVLVVLTHLRLILLLLQDILYQFLDVEFVVGEGVFLGFAEQPLLVRFERIVEVLDSNQRILDGEAFADLLALLFHHLPPPVLDDLHLPDNVLRLVYVLASDVPSHEALDLDGCAVVVTRAVSLERFAFHLAAFRFDCFGVGVGEEVTIVVDDS